MRKMYKVLLGQIEAPDDVTPDFMREELSGVGNAATQAMERGRFLKVSPTAVAPTAFGSLHQKASRFSRGRHCIRAAAVCD